ncbi:hypothetical protein HQ489_00675 [Candidatus Woesearchaeota archaeon]|nr:hypothetical protein [Candidatus Woesearchaeota archaeon]
MSEEAKYYQGFLLALREHTDQFLIDGPKYQQAFIKAIDGTDLEADVDLAFGTSGAAGRLILEGMAGLLLASDCRWRTGYLQISKTDAARELEGMDQAEVYRNSARIFWEELRN